MDEVIAEKDPDLTPGQKILVSKLTDSELQIIDESLIKNSCEFWRKVARVIGATMGELSKQVENIPDVFYASRIRLLVENGKLESQGDLHRMRFSEIRVPGEEVANV